MIRTSFRRKSISPRFPRRADNRLDLLVDGQCFLPAMLEAISAAGHYILIEMYLFESGRLATHFIEALLAAAQRGVIVRILIDNFGGLGLHARDRSRLTAGGVALSFYNPLHLGRLSSYLHRDHRKLLLVDGRVAFTGGSGISDDFDPTIRHKRWWHDLMVRMQGPIVKDWQILFERTWRSAGNDSPALPWIPIPQAGSDTARLTANDGRRPHIQRQLARHINQAQQRVWISVAYFVPPVRIRNALRRAAERGVDVRLILPSHHTDHQFARYAGRRFYSQLLRSGVRIFEYMPRFTHVKLMVCDNWVSLGSANLDHWTLRWNLEANLEVYGMDFATIAQNAFASDLAESLEITLMAWRARSRRTRIREWFWSLISGWLERIRPRRHDPRN